VEVFDVPKNKEKVDRMPVFSVHHVSGGCVCCECVARLPIETP